ncbi:hypothetical protein lacNasYZ02_05300 [Lactobacillus nasalidis]|nr:hypothetical protein lacNasYZ01_02100 [Lactobacillus nasalidis]GHV99100.1 hypothetical protein lacNasYZ02_05300 [Lactobacillus nasalidis]
MQRKDKIIISQTLEAVTAYIGGEAKSKAAWPSCVIKKGLKMPLLFFENAVIVVIEKDITRFEKESRRRSNA